MSTQVQCRKCPWKKSTNPREIPNGYCELRHAALTGTIAKPGELRFGGTLRIMACHESPVGRERACVGWLANQLGPGNNIPLRMHVARGRINGNLRLVGEQHDRIEDTLPRTP